MSRSDTRVAVIGSGVSGLAAAWTLAGRARVSLFEADARPGGHAHTILHDGRPLDTGFLVFNERRYPLFSRLLRQLGVPSRPTQMSFSVSQAGGFSYGSETLRAFFADRQNLIDPIHLRFGARILRFLSSARRDVASGFARPLGLYEYSEERRVPSDVYNQFIAPLAGALWSMGERLTRDFPAHFFLQFLHTHGMLRPAFPPRWRTIRGGSAVYVAALLRRIHAALHLNTCVAQISRDNRGVTLGLSDGREARFDHLIIATHSDQALALLEDPTEAEQRVLSKVRYTQNDVCLHSESSFLPKAKDARAAWNVQVESGDQVSITYWLNKLQGIPGPTDYCVTLNPDRPISPGQQIARYQTSHPLFDRHALAAQAELPLLQGRCHTAFAGAYFGFGFHEDGFRSGVAAAEALHL